MVKKNFGNVEHHILEMDNIFKSFSSTLEKFNNEHGFANSKSQIKNDNIISGSCSKLWYRSWNWK